jgi:RsiW-degrading membrane proteinase PrsW (M82 family)
VLAILAGLYRLGCISFGNFKERSKMKRLRDVVYIIIAVALPILFVLWIKKQSRPMKVRLALLALLGGLICALYLFGIESEALNGILMSVISMFLLIKTMQLTQR